MPPVSSLPGPAGGSWAGVASPWPWYLDDGAEGNACKEYGSGGVQDLWLHLVSKHHPPPINAHVARSSVSMSVTTWGFPHAEWPAGLRCAWRVKSRFKRKHALTPRARIDMSWPSAAGTAPRVCTRPAGASRRRRLPPRSKARPRRPGAAAAVAVILLNGLGRPRHRLVGENVPIKHTAVTDEVRSRVCRWCKYCKTKQIS